MSDNKDNKINNIPLVVILGATGVQGGSVVKSLLETKKYKIRGLTRNVDSESSKKLKEKGVEMVKCNLFNKKDIENGFENADIVYAVTNFWDPEIAFSDPRKEELQGKMIVDVAKDKNIKWLLWSSLCNVESESNGELKNVHHFTGKNNVEKYIRQLGIPSTFIYLAFYASNIGTFFKVYDDTNNENKILPIPYCDDKTFIDIVDTASDTGPVVSRILKNKDKYLNKIVPIAGDRLTFGEIADIYGKKINKKIRVINVDRKTISEKYNELNNEEIIQMCEWFKKYGYYGNTGFSYKDTKNIYPNITSFDNFMSK